MKLNKLVVASAMGLLLASESTNAMQKAPNDGNNEIFTAAATFQTLRPFLDENESLKKEALGGIADQCGYGQNHAERQAFIDAFVSEADQNDNIMSAASGFWNDLIKRA